MHPIIEFDAENQLLPVPRPQELDKSGSDLTFAAQVIDNQAQGLPAESLAATASTSMRPVRNSSRKRRNEHDEDRTCADCGLWISELTDLLCCDGPLCTEKVCIG